MKRNKGMRSMAARGLVQVLLLALIGCTDSEPEPTPEEPRTGQAENVRYTLDENTVWLRPGMPITVLEQTPDRLVLSARPRGLEPGKVLVSSQGTGVLRKVRAVRQEGTSVVVETEPATLAEAFEELELEIREPLGRAELGDVVSDVPGVDFEWVQDPSAGSQGRSAEPSLEFNTLKMSFNHAELSSGGIDVDGEVFLRLHPVLTLRTKPSSGGLPRLTFFEGGARPEFHGTLTVSSSFGGSVSADRKWIDRPIGVVVWGPLVFVAKLRVASAISGVANGAFRSTYSVQASAVGLVGWSEPDGWYSRGDIAPVRSGEVHKAKATLEVQADLLTVELRFDLYALAGPYVRSGTYAKLTGDFDVGPDDQEGVLVRLGGGLNLEAGVSTDFQEMLGTDEDVGLAVVSADVPLVTVYEHFFPFEGAASIVVTDNGPAAEDIFEVELDGIFLGRTQRGGTGQFRATDLRPGRHRLTIMCIDDGWAGGDIGTLGVTLGDGLTFSDGTAALSDTLFQGEMRTYEVNVPTGLVAGAGSPPPPMPRNESPERSR